MGKDIFTTSFGNKISIIDGYRDTLPPSYDSSNYDKNKKPPEESIWGIWADIYQFSIFLDWLEFKGLSSLKFNKLLDVGGNTGLIARLFHSMGIAENVQCIDICDFSESLSMDRIVEMIKKIKESKNIILDLKMKKSFSQKVLNFINKKKIKNKRKEEKNSAFLILKLLKTSQSMHPAPIPKCIFEISEENLKLNNYIHGDFYKLKEKYDCITSFSSLDHFNPEDFFKKAYTLLNKDGYLYIWNINWYYIINPPCVYGNFPYTAQRLTRKDLERYFKEFHPEEKDKVIKAYDYYHCGNPGYILNDYINIAFKNGFIPVGVHRLIPKEGKIPEMIANWKIQGEYNHELFNEILRDIHCFKKDVTMLDLITESFFWVFKKI